MNKFIDKHPIITIGLILFLIMFTFFFTLYLVGGVTLKEAFGVSFIHTIFLECMGIMYISLLSLHDKKQCFYNEMYITIPCGVTGSTKAFGAFNSGSSPDEGIKE